MMYLPPIALAMAFAFGSIVTTLRMYRRRR
jgi:hypothetical protein